ncbi:hypothetical protein K4K57_004874 [Colletotrichum sp. SAR 10_99]|nr:hypothetical protein K4K55_004757 [Colletotrichum sp. SAR 10_96]KAJ5012021.1 hypothetical protein K4K57_004874 [Colletotrichum sp. SAR 10_99]
MKVLILGLPRTGTQCLAAALADALIQLGISPVYHMREVGVNHHQEFWIRAIVDHIPPFSPSEQTKITTTPWTREQWDTILAPYEAVSDFPPALFPTALAAAYPDCPIILSTRSFESWAASMRDTLVHGLWEILRADRRGGTVDYSDHSASPPPQPLAVHSISRHNNINITEQSPLQQEDSIMDKLRTFFDNPFFDPRHKTKVHILQLVIMTTAIILTIARMAMPVITTRANMMALTMGIKSFIIIGYQLITGHKERFKKWASLKANAILNTMEIVFCVLAFQTSVVSIKEFRYFKNYGVTYETNYPKV